MIQDSVKNVFAQLELASINNETKSMAFSLRNKTHSITSDQNLKELIIAIKEIVRSVKRLTKELGTSQKNT